MQKITYVSARAKLDSVWAVTPITHQLLRGMLRGSEPSILNADPMTVWLGIVLGAMAFAGTAIAGSAADYIGLLDCFPPPDSSDIGPVSRDYSDSTQALSLASKTDFLTDLGP